VGIPRKYIYFRSVPRTFLKECPDDDLNDALSSGKRKTMGTGSASVGFICDNPKHLHKNGDLSDQLTIHETQWAYCPRDIRADGHRWRPTGGISLSDLESLVRGMRAKDGGNGEGKHRD
jgi:hypothetical protein